jgi:hypothetical protein
MIFTCDNCHNVEWDTKIIGVFCQGKFSPKKKVVALWEKVWNLLNILTN